MSHYEVGHGLTAENVSAWATVAETGLVPDEQILGFYNGAPVSSRAQITLVTTARIVFAETRPALAFNEEHRLAEIVDVRANRMGFYGEVIVRKADGQKVKTVTGNVTHGKKADAAALAALIERAKAHPLHASSAANLPASDPANGRNVPIAAPAATGAHNPKRLDHPWSGSTLLVGDPLKAKAMSAIVAHCSPGEEPWLVISSSGAGALAAFDDRVLMVKVGAVTSWMAGSMGGGRTATFHFTDITGIEYNAGLMNGVLEILTASYSGSANKDYWRGSTASRNADVNDPHTQSNTLPLVRQHHEAALPHLNDLRSRISRSKQPRAHNDPAPAPGASLASELANLASLRESGVLTDEEFSAAKARLLQG